MIRIDFTRDEYEYIKDKAMLNDELSKIFEMKIKGYSNIQIAMELNMSDSTLARRLKTLRKKIMKVIWHVFEWFLIERWQVHLFYFC